MQPCPIYTGVEQSLSSLVSVSTVLFFVRSRVLTVDNELNSRFAECKHVCRVYFIGHSVNKLFV